LMIEMVEKAACDVDDGCGDVEGGCVEFTRLDVLPRLFFAA